MLFLVTYGPSYVALSLGFKIIDISKRMLLLTVCSLASCVDAFCNSADTLYQFFIIFAFGSRSLLFFRSSLYPYKITSSKKN
jgi:hypothetical protein